MTAERAGSAPEFDRSATGRAGSSWPVRSTSAMFRKTPSRRVSALILGDIGKIVDEEMILIDRGLDQSAQHSPMTRVVTAPASHRLLWRKLALSRSAGRWRVASKKLMAPLFVAEKEGWLRGHAFRSCRQGLTQDRSSELVEFDRVAVMYAMPAQSRHSRSRDGGFSASRLSPPEK